MQSSVRCGAVWFGILFFSVFSLGSVYAQRYPEDFASLRGGSLIAGPQGTANSFFIGRHEVTQRDYREIMGTNPSEVRDASLPVEYVSWYDAILYCNRRSALEKLQPPYRIVKPTIDPLTWTVIWDKQADGYRLPTEGEWEYAYRIALGTGTELTDPNGAGISGLNGGVWEWCWSGDEGSGPENDPTAAAVASVLRNFEDAYSQNMAAALQAITNALKARFNYTLLVDAAAAQEYKTAAALERRIVDDLRSISFGPNRVSRNGFWVQSGELLHAEIRRMTAPTYRSGYIGFRVVRSDFTAPKGIQPMPRRGGMDYPVSISLKPPKPDLSQPGGGAEITPEPQTSTPERFEIDADTLEVEELRLR